MTDLFVSAAEPNLLVFWAVLFALLVLAGECGYRIERWRIARRRETEVERSGISTVTASMFALLAFTLGLTISFSQSRFEARRDLVVQEANTIGTAWLRARMAGGQEGPAIVSLIEDYAQVRLDYTTTAEPAQIAALLERTNTLQTEMWRLVTELAQRVPTPITATLINALNDMFDASLAQRFAFGSRIPLSLALTLLGGSLLAIGAMGYQLAATGSRQIVLSVLSLLMWAGAMVLIIDFNRARIGTIRVDPGPLVWTIQGFGSSH